MGKNFPKTLQTSRNYPKLFIRSNCSFRIRKNFFSRPRAELGPTLPQNPISQKSKSSFLFTIIVHIYPFVGSSIAILWLVPWVIMVIKQKKVKTLVSAMALHQARAVEAVAASPLPAEQNMTQMIKEKCNNLVRQINSN